MDNVKLTTLEDGKKYVILDEILGSNKFVYLMDMQDENNFIIRKEINKDNTNYLNGLDNEEEFKEALALYQQKNA